MPLTDWLRLHRRARPRIGDDGLTTTERRPLAAEYQAGAAARPTAAQKADLRAKMNMCSKRQ